ncbi:MAG: 30S ribosomal protein S6 [Deltaproteobacteria bacterium]|nr:30S ribosomal protein S6 [Deltaproteobacteria bacterium]
MREYETIYIMRPDVTTEVVQEISDRFKSNVEKGGGSIIQIKSWGNRKLAYPVKKHLKGVYIYNHYLGERNLVTDVERTLRMIEPVIKYMTVKIDENIDPDTRPFEGEYLGLGREEEEEEKPVSEGDLGDDDEKDSLDEHDYNDIENPVGMEMSDEEEPLQDYEADAEEQVEEPEPEETTDDAPEVEE